MPTEIRLRYVESFVTSSPLSNDRDGNRVQSRARSVPPYLMMTKEVCGKLLRLLEASQRMRSVVLTPTGLFIAAARSLVKSNAPGRRSMLLRQLTSLARNTLKWLSDWHICSQIIFALYNFRIFCAHLTSLDRTLLSTSVSPSVRPSVCQTRAPRQNEITVCKYVDTVRQSVFLVS